MVTKQSAKESSAEKKVGWNEVLIAWYKLEKQKHLEMIMVQLC